MDWEEKKEMGLDYRKRRRARSVFSRCSIWPLMKRSIRAAASVCWGNIMEFDVSEMPIVSGSGILRSIDGVWWSRFFRVHWRKWYWHVNHVGWMPSRSARAIVRAKKHLPCVYHQKKGRIMYQKKGGEHKLPISRHVLMITNKGGSCFTEEKFKKGKLKIAS